MVEFDPMLVFILTVILGFVFIVYLFFRRTVTSFREGVEGGRD